jgi:hypothetical protein
MEDAHSVRKWSQGNAGRFAGMWFENEPGHPLLSRLGVGVVGSVEHLTAELAGLLEHPQALFVVGMTWTHEELDAFRERVTRELLLTASLTGSPMSGNVVGVGADGSRNRVVVQLSAHSDCLAAEIVARYSDEVVIVENPPPDSVVTYTTL